MNEDLRDWFGKGKRGGVGGGGWDRYNTKGERVGKCGDAKEGDPYSACLSKEKARKLGKAGIAAFVKRKRAAQSKAGDAKKGNERSKGQAPVRVKTKANESVNLTEKLTLFLEKNVPTNPSKWSYYVSRAKEKFDVYPSAYANAWAAKMYKKAGGKWKTSESLTTEANLLTVSKPYEFSIGDRVKNINPNCTHYKSTGEVIYVHDNGDITYQVDNNGATYSIGDELTKSQSQLVKTLKTFTRTPLPGYGSFTNECVVAKINVDGKTILAKNRDRGYKAQIEIIHEIVAGIEVVYLHDKLTDWSEGMNEYGIGIINASLQVDFDEKEGDLAKQNLEKGKAPKVSYDGLKIRTALANNKLSEAIQSIVYYKGEDEKDVGVKGMTIVSNLKHSFIIEMTSKHLPVIKKIDKDDTIVRTNHGVEYKDTGYTSGVKRDSSISRMNLAKEALKKVKSAKEVLNAMSKQYTKDNFMNPYRRKNKYDMETTSQVMYNLDDLEFHLRWDIDHSEFKGIVNRLPKGYKPKIKIVVEKTD